MAGRSWMVTARGGAVEGRALRTKRSSQPRRQCARCAAVKHWRASRHDEIFWWHRSHDHRNRFAAHHASATCAGSDSVASLSTELGTKGEVRMALVEVQPHLKQEQQKPLRGKREARTPHSPVVVCWWNCFLDTGHAGGSLDNRGCERHTKDDTSHRASSLRSCG